MTGLLYLTLLAVVQCGHDAEGFVSQPDTTVRVRPGLSISLECHIKLSAQLNLFWIKIPVDSNPVCIATTPASSDDVKMCNQFENHSRVKATRNKSIFYLSFSSVEPSDIATYVCGTHKYNEYFFGNGSELIFEENTGAVSPNAPTEANGGKGGKMQVFQYLVVALAATNVSSVLLIIGLCCVLKKKRLGVTSESTDVGDNKTEELSYAALSFQNKQRRTVEKRTNVDPKVIYGAVRHQEEL